MHIFRYSKRPGTAAAEMEDQVRDDVKQLRSKKLHDMKIQMENSYMETFVGKDVEAMLETRRMRNERLTGITRHYLRVYADGPDELLGKLVVAQAVNVDSGSLDVENLRPAGGEVKKLQKANS